MDIEGALFTADTVGTFLEFGGAKAYLYGYEPNYLQDELKCSWGNLMMLQLNPNNDQVNRLSAYYAAQLITKEWMQPTNETARDISRNGKTKQAAASSGVYDGASARINSGRCLQSTNIPRRTSRLNVQFKLPGAQQPSTFRGTG